MVMLGVLYSILCPQHPFVGRERETRENKPSFPKAGVLFAASWKHRNMNDI